jgi:hypothetical protein
MLTVTPLRVLGARSESSYDTIASPTEEKRFVSPDVCLFTSATSFGIYLCMATKSESKGAIPNFQAKKPPEASLIIGLTLFHNGTEATAILGILLPRFTECKRLFKTTILLSFGSVRAKDLIDGQIWLPSTMSRRTSALSCRAFSKTFAFSEASLKLDVLINQCLGNDVSEDTSYEQK